MKQINAEETPYAVKSVGALFCSRCLTKIPDGLIMICYGSWKYCPSCATQVFGSDTHNVMEQELEGKMQQNDINNGHELQGPFFQAKEPGKTHGTITRKNINPHEFDVLYRCKCGGYLQFGAEVQKQCTCGCIYQLRVMIWRVK